jgi:hypothetical protein
VLKKIGNFEFEFQLLNATGFAILRKELNPDLIYEVNTELSCIKWLHSVEGYKVVEVNFQNKKDVAMSLKFAIVQCLYEYKAKKSLKDEIAEDEIAYINQTSEEPFNIENPQIVKPYENVKEEL